MMFLSYARVGSLVVILSIVFFLQVKSADSFKKDEIAFQQAVCHGTVADVKILYDSSFTCHRKKGFSPFTWAVLREKVEVIEFLLNSDPTLANATVVEQHGKLVCLVDGDMYFTEKVDIPVFIDAARSENLISLFIDKGMELGNFGLSIHKRLSEQLVVNRSRYTNAKKVIDKLVGCGLSFDVAEKCRRDLKELTEKIDDSQNY